MRKKNKRSGVGGLVLHRRIAGSACAWSEEGYRCFPKYGLTHHTLRKHDSDGGQCANECTQLIISKSESSWPTHHWDDMRDTVSRIDDRTREHTLSHRAVDPRRSESEDRLHSNVPGVAEISNDCKGKK